jgi:hypothetical protein
MLHGGTRLCVLLAVRVAAAGPVAVITMAACKREAVLSPVLPRNGCAATALLVQASPSAGRGSLRQLQSGLKQRAYKPVM